MPAVSDFRAACAKWGKILICTSLLLTLTAMAGAYHPWFDLISQFRFQLLLFSLAVPVFWMLGEPRHQAWTIISLAALLLNSAAVAPLYQKEPPARPLDSVNLRVCTVNVYTPNQNINSVLEYVASEQPEILVFLEIDRRWLESLSPLEPFYPHRISHPRDDNFGIAVFSRIPFINSHLRQFSAADIPSLVCSFHMNGRVITVVATHAMPPINLEYQVLRDLQLRSLAEFIAEREGPLILAGDLNLTMFSPIYKQFEQRTGLQNSRQGFGVLPTWPAASTPVMRLPLDHILHSPDMMAVACRVGADIGSDHLPLSTDLVFFSEEKTMLPLPVPATPADSTPTFTPSSLPGETLP